jgi:hypothetical protein
MSNSEKCVIRLVTQETHTLKSSLSYTVVVVVVVVVKLAQAILPFIEADSILV